MRSFNLPGLARGWLLGIVAAVALPLAAAAPAHATLRTTIKAAIAAVYAGSNDFAAPEFNLPYADDIVMRTGTGTNQADKLFADQRTITASSSEDLDLAGVLTDPLGATLTCVKLKAIYIKAAAANTNDVLVGGASATQITGLFSNVNDVIVVKPGGVFLWVAPQAGIAVGASSTDLLKVANSSSGTGVTYDIVLICTSA